jgi:hypothetical protein
MIEFRCWYCNRRHEEPKRLIEQRITCGGCGYPLKVPRRSGGNCRIRTLTDVLVENLVYGGFGAIIGMIPGCAGLAGLSSPQRYNPHAYDPYWWLFPICGCLFGIAAGNGWTRWLAPLFRDDD